MSFMHLYPCLIMFIFCCFRGYRHILRCLCLCFLRCYLGCRIINRSTTGYAEFLSCYNGSTAGGTVGSSLWLLFSWHLLTAYRAEH